MGETGAPMIFQIVWATENEHFFEQSVPLLWHGEYLARKGWGNGIRLGFLEGLDLLSGDYLHNLERLGYEVIDCSHLVKECLDEYPQLKTYRKTLRYWFLRWNVLGRLTEQLPDATTVVHLDADIVLQVDPAELYRDVTGKTFVLQGCPVITVISCRQWFSVWRAELASFLANPDGYALEALRVKENPVRPSREFCNGLYYVPGRFHDQDMLEYLIAAGKLPQERSEKIFDSGYYWMHTPLFPAEWAAEQAGGIVVGISDKEDGSYVGNKRISFHHMHTDFVKYCYYWLIAHRLKLGGKRILSFLDAITEKEPAFFGFLWKLTLLFKRTRYISRLNIYDEVFRINENTDNLYIVDIINSRWNK